MVAMMLALVAAPVARAQAPLDALGPAGLQDVLASVRYCAGVSKDYQVAERDLCILNAEQVPTRVFKGQEPRKRLTPEQIRKAAAARKARAEAAKAEADRLLQEKINAAVAAKVEPLQRRVAQLEAQARAATQRELAAGAVTRQALEQNRAIAESRDEKTARPMWFVAGLLSLLLGLAAYLVFMRGAGRVEDDDEPPQGPRGPSGGERRLTDEDLRADEVRKPTTEEFPVFSVPQSGEPEPPKEAQEVAPAPISADVLAAIERLDPHEEGPTAVDAQLEMATSGSSSVGQQGAVDSMKDGSAPEVEEDLLTTRRSLAGRSLARVALPWEARQPIHEEIFDLLEAATKRKDEAEATSLRALLGDASAASSQIEITDVKARLAAAQERNK